MSSDLNNITELKPRQAMTGITLSFTLLHGNTSQEKMLAQMNLNAFARAVHELQRTGFQGLKHTVISRQEYEP